MTEKPSTPPRAPDEIDQEFVESLRAAAFVFEKEAYGRFTGAPMACRAVARYIFRRGGAAELAGPFLNIAEAFDVLGKGGKPRLFAKKTTPEKERDRSPDRKHSQMLASVYLDVLVKLGDELDIAAAMVARGVNSWPGMSAQKVTSKTVIAWRKGFARIEGRNHEKFVALVEMTLKEANPRQTVDDYLRRGPPGSFQS
jgi:hypothetical protein